MRIISKIPDYYDKISYLYGQDPDITYHRKDIDSKDIVMHVGAYDNHCYPRNYNNGNLLCNRRSKYAQRTVDWQTIIAGQYMLKVGFRTERNVKVPILELSGVNISKLVTAEQMWQSVYHCLTNVLRVNPDKQPPATVSNQERIWASGFDEKVSFRHRK